MNEQYITLIGKVCSPRYEEVYTPEVKSKLPIEASSEGRNLKDYTIYGNNNPNHVDESQSTLPVSIDTYGGNAEDWEIYGNNNPVVETKNGNLPLEITSSAGNVIDYTIYGNNNCNKNLLEITAESQTINGVTFTVDKQAGTIIANGTATNGLNIEIGRIYNGLNEPFNYYLSGNADGGSEQSYFLIGTSQTGTRLKRWNGTTDMRGSVALTDDVEMQIPANETGLIRIYIRNGANADNLVFKPMLREADTTPPDFEPHRIGVGENTEITGELPVDFRSNGDDLLRYEIYGTSDGVGEIGNLFNKNAPYTSGKYLNTSGAEVSGATWGISEYIPIEGNTTYTAYNLSGGGASACWYNENKNFIDGENYGGAATKSFSLPSNARYIRLTLRLVNPSNVDTLMLIKGTVSPSEYIPYGYKIPLVISSGTKTKTIDAYIGDSKLGEEEYIDYGEQKIYKRILFMTHDDKHFITKDNKDFCLRRRGYSG